jgi:hypothetical protein
MSHRVLPLIVWAACTGPQQEANLVTLEDGGVVNLEEHTNVVRRFFFMTETEEGLVDGFDLDGLDSPVGELESCGHGDIGAPDGRTGIDNQLGRTWSVLEPLVGTATEALLQGIINEGRFLMMYQLTDLDDLVNDDDVQLELFYGNGSPDIGTYGVITPDQTFTIDDTKEATPVLPVSLVDGVIEAGPMDFTVPLDVLEEYLEIRVKNGRVRIEVHEDGTFTGVMGGSVDVEDSMTQLLDTNASQEARLVEPIFYNSADMGYVDGACTMLSVAFGFEGTNAFVVRYDDTP